MIRNLLSRAALTGALILAPSAAGACDLDLSAPQLVRFTGSDNEGYDSFDGSRFQVEFSVSARNIGDERCTGLLAARSFDDSISLASGSGGALQYEITTPGGGVNLVRTAGTPIQNTNSVPIDIDVGRTQIVSLVMRIPPRQITSAGNYSQPLLLSFLDGTDGTVTAEQAIEMVAAVRSTMSIFLFESAIASHSALTVGQNNSYLLDFEEFEDGEQLSVSVLVQSNNPYSMRMLSENGGALAHTILTQDQRIPYEVTFAGRRVNLSGGSTTLTGLSATDQSGRQGQLTVRIGKVGLARAGTYRDVLTISIQPD